MRLGPYRVSLSKALQDASIQGHTIESDDLDALLSRLSPVPASASPQLLEQVSVDDIASAEGTRKARAALRDHGIVIVREFVDHESALAAGRVAFALADRAQESAASGEVPRDFTLETSGAGNYYDMAESSNAVVNLRKGSDAGMVDVFNFDLVARREGQVLREALSASEVMALLNPLERGAWIPANLNVYVNRGITRTRMFHADSYGIGQVKAFLYLTDVQELADGPYCYVLDSHLPGPYRDMNLALTQARGIFSPTDVPVIDPRKALPILAPAGSLVVSNQAGAHRGVPQMPGHTRAIAVLNIVAKGR